MFLNSYSTGYCFQLDMCAIYRLLFLMTSGVTSLSLQQVNEEWNLFKLKFNRTFTSTEEENYRFSVFTMNLKTILSHNMAADKGHHSYWLGVNDFADLTDKEFEEQYTGLNIIPRTAKTVGEKHIEHLNFNLTSLPKQIDWRKKKCVTRVKFQGRQCNSCYAFAVTGALEGRTCIKTGKLASLSEQNIVDCTNNRMYLNHGCKGGHTENSYQYVIENGGIDTEKSYPYRAKVGKCQFKLKSVGATAKKYIDIEYANEAALQEAVANGPVSVAIDASGLKLYQHGVYTGFDTRGRRTCRSGAINHAMLAVGYGVSMNGKDYWLLKNSLGTKWGIKGYMKLIRNKNNRCGIASRASYPVV